MSGKKALILVFFLLLVAGIGYQSRVKIKYFLEDWWKEKSLPPALTVNSASSSAVLPIAGDRPAVSAELARTLPPAEINLAVPFIMQSPFSKWDFFHNETCEEAAALMVQMFYQQKTELTKREAEDAIVAITEWEKEHLGFFEDTTAEETAQVMREFLNLPGATAVMDVSMEDIKTEVAAGRPVIVPAAGKLLPNPYFRNGGPRYHMVVVKGYTQDGRFITNDPGVGRGKDFLYKFGDLYNAMHDWVKDGDILTGGKAMIVVR